MDRRKFLAIGAASAGMSIVARAHETGYPHEHKPGGLVMPTGPLLSRKIPSTGETIYSINSGGNP